MLTRNRKGFTLIELLTVVAVFSILAEVFHLAMQETYRHHAINNRDQKLIWLLSGQEAILRATPYRELAPGEHKVTPELLKGSGILGAQASFTTEELQPGLKRITLTAGYPFSAKGRRSLSLVIYRSGRP